MKPMKIHFDTLQFSRTRITELIEGLTDKQLTTIPTGLKTNIIWNIGHIISTQQLFMYKRTGLKFTIKTEIIDKFRSGTKASTEVVKDDMDYLKGILFSTLEQVQNDYNSGKFKQFESFTTKRGIAINSVESAIAFHTFHEGVHLGWIWTMRKLV